MISTLFFLFAGLILGQAIRNHVPGGNLAPVNPASTQVLSSIGVKSSFTTVSPDGKTLLLYNIDTISIGVYDISNIGSPTLSSSISFESDPEGVVAAVFSSDSKTGYIVHDNEGDGELLVVDLSDLMSPVTLSAFNLSAGTGPIAISPDDQTIFILACMGTNPSTVMVIDVSNPASPYQLSSFAYQYNYQSCTSSNATLYIHGDSLIYSTDSSLEAINISNLASPTLLDSVIAKFPIGVVISYDGKYAFVLRDLTLFREPFSLEIYSLSNLSSIQKISSLDLSQSLDTSGIGTMSISPDNNYIFLAGSDTLGVINVSDVQIPAYQTIDAISNPKFVAMTPDGRTAFLTSDTAVTVLELYLDTRTQQISFPSNVVHEIPLPIVPMNFSVYELKDFVITSDQNTAFMVYYEGYLAIFDVSNKTAPTFLSFYQNTDSYFGSVVLSPDERTIFMVGYTLILIIDVSNLTSPILVNTLPTFINTSLGSPQFEISSDGKIGFVQQDGIQIVNISDLAAPTNISTYACHANAFTLSEDEKMIFLMGSSSINTLDISNLSSPKIIHSVMLSFNDPISISVSPDNKTAFINLYDSSGDNFIKVLDFLNPTSPVEIDWSTYNIKTSQRAIVSSDSSTVFIATSTELLVIDVPRVTTPRILNAYPIPSIVAMVLSENESTMYLATTNGTLVIVNLTPHYSLEMWNSDFFLGETYSITLEAFQITKDKYLSPMEQNYSFTTMSLYCVTSLPNTEETETVTTYPLLPDWIDFDQTHGIVTFRPHSQTQVGLYQIYSAMSFIIPDDTFVGVGNITNAIQSLDLIVSLISLGYMNTQGFLTSNYDPNNELYLSSEYSSFESDIRSKLSAYYIQMITSFDVASSLSFSFSQHISISTKSQSTISVIISIFATADVPQAQFVKDNYPIMATYSNNQSTITMEGTLNSINNALTQIIINLNENITSCEGSITISDGLNPLLPAIVINISNLFILNEAPILGYSIQDYVDEASIYTGEQFVIQINGTFIDSNGQDLDYSLSMQDNSQVPGWLTIRDSSLVGTPPEQLTGDEIHIVITAKNQFKSSQQLVIIKIKISVLYGLKLAGTYGGAFLTIVGLWIYLGTIHNILCKKRYRYPKDFFIKVGDEKSVGNVCSIGFIGKEIRASKIVLHEIKKAIATECNIKKLKNYEVAAYFFDWCSGEFEDEKFINMVKCAMLKLGMKDTLEQNGDSSSIKGYLRKEVIKQLVLYEILKYQIDLDKEEETKQAFDTIKIFWILLVKPTRDPLHYILDKAELQKRLLAQGIKSYYPHLTSKDKNKLLLDAKDYINKAEDTIEVEVDGQLLQLNEEPSLVLREKTSQEQSSLSPLVQNKPKTKRSKLNHDLLERLLISTAFRYHNLDINPYDIRVIVNQKPSGNKLWLKIKKLFKRDLASIEFSGKGEAVYGLKYEVKKGILKLYGTPEEELGGETVIVQVITKRGWILRELWLHCIPSSVKVENENI